MNTFQALLHAANGIAESAARHQLKTDPRLRRKIMKKRSARAETCTPCNAAGYVHNLRKAFGG